MRDQNRNRNPMTLRVVERGKRTQNSTAENGGCLFSVLGSGKILLIGPQNTLPFLTLPCPQADSSPANFGAEKIDYLTCSVDPDQHCATIVILTLPSTHRPNPSMQARDHARLPGGLTDSRLTQSTDAATFTT